MYREATQKIYPLYRVIILSDNYRLSLPVGSFIVLASPTRTTAQTRVGKWQTRVVRYCKDPVKSFSDPSISRATAVLTKQAARVVSIAAEIATFYTLLRLSGLKAAGHAQPERAHGELSQPEVTEAIPDWRRRLGKLKPELVPYLQVTHLFQHILCFLLKTHIEPLPVPLSLLVHTNFMGHFSANPSYHKEERNLITSCSHSCTCGRRDTVISSTCGSTEKVLSSTWGSTDTVLC